MVKTKHEKIAPMETFDLLMHEKKFRHEASDLLDKIIRMLEDPDVKSSRKILKEMAQLQLRIYNMHNAFALATLKSLAFGLPDEFKESLKNLD